MTTYPFLNPKQKIIFTDTKALKEQTDKDFKFIYNDLGIFTYSKNGFDAAFDTQVTHIDWEEIRAVFGYKVDLFTTDLICLYSIQRWNGGKTHGRNSRLASISKENS